MAKLRFGIIGAGGIARSHANALGGLQDRAELVAACDTLPAAAEKFGKDLGIPTYSGPDAVERMLEHRDLDAVSIATPSGLHAAQAIMALEAGKHVLTEKPMAITTEQLDAMVAAQRRCGQALGCVFQHRFDVGTRILKEAIASGRMGRILHANAYLKWYRSQEYYDAGGWRGTWAMDGGGALMNQSVHYIDLLQWLTGGVAAVKAYTGTLNHRIETEDEAVAAVRLRAGGLGTIEGMTCAIANGYDRVEIYGSEGMGIYQAGDLTHYYTRAEAPAPTPEQPRPPQNLAEQAKERFRAEHPGWKTGHPAVFAGFIDALLAGQEPPVPGPEGRKAVEIILGIYRSNQENIEVTFA